MEERFGKKLASYKGDITAGGLLWIVVGALLLSALFSLGKALIGLVLGEDQWELLLTGFLAGAVGLALSLLPLSKWRQRVDVYAQGLVWQRLIGRVVVDRQQVSSVQVTERRDRMSSFTEVSLLLTDGHEVVISGISNAEYLAAAVRAWSAPAPAAGVSPGWTPPSQNGEARPVGGWTPPPAGG